MKHKIFDLHCDTLSALWNIREAGTPVSLAKNDLHVDLQRLRAGGATAQVFAAFVNTAKSADPFADLLSQIALYHTLVFKNPDLYAVTSAADLCDAREAGAVAAILGVEDLGVIEGNASRIADLVARGMRIASLTWNHKNALAAPNNVAAGRANTADRLTPTGVRVVEDLAARGVAIDVAHLSDGGFYHLLDVVSCPVLASHTAARAVTPHVRNLTDDMIVRIADRGGIVGLSYYDAFLTGSGTATLADVVRHAKHIVKVGGSEVLALGSDFDGIPKSHALPDAAALPRLVDALTRDGFSARAVEQITSANAIRFFQTVLP